jgi:hypothetical protein
MTHPAANRLAAFTLALLTRVEGQLVLVLVAAAALLSEARANRA